MTDRTSEGQDSRNSFADELYVTRKDITTEGLEGSHLFRNAEVEVIR